MERAVSGTMAFASNAKAGKGTCTRCGREVSIRKDESGTIHLCRDCRHDKWFAKEVGYAVPAAG